MVGQLSELIITSIISYLYLLIEPLGIRSRNMGLSRDAS